MDETDSEKIERLVGYLRGSELLEWEQVEECVSGFPGWVRMLQMLRYPAANSNTRLISMGSPLQYSAVLPEKRKQLLEIFLPYALLLDATRTPSERAAALKTEGYDVAAFCKENQANGSREIADAARNVLQAHRTGKDLLRGSEKPEVSANELLRVAQSHDSKDDSLLLPSDMPPMAPQSRGLLARIKQRLFPAKD